MTKDKKIKLLIAIIALFICIIQIKETYAKYVESKDGDAQFTVASWKIKINNSDITQSANLSSLINPVYESNTNIKDGVIAPGSQGYFDIDIDASNTEVSFNYEITVTPSEESDVTDLIIYAYKINNGEIANIENNVNTITNRINNIDENKTLSLRIYFKWLDGEGEQMNNAADTAAAVGRGTGKINVNAKFTQVIN